MTIRYQGSPKRLGDVLVSAALLILTSPLSIFIAALVRFRLGTPVFFRQVRSGRQEQDFNLIKFRTMTDGKGGDGELLPDSERLTSLGSWLRRTSLDELPELVNVLLGHMSIVGPRPLPTRYTPFFTERERLRFDVRPGITGLAQVSGRNDMPWSERFAADVEYVTRCSFRLDLLILARTVVVALNRNGLRVDPGAHMPDFDVERSAGQGATRVDHAE